MARQSLLFRSILFLFFVILTVSTVSIKQPVERTKNVLSSADRACAAVPGKCFAGNCIGGACSACPYDPLQCCLSTLGTCYSAGGVAYGLCAPTCSCYGC